MSDPDPAEPSAQVDPEAYLCSRKFSSTLTCRRTGKRVSYADIGDSNGIPLLWLTPSGCSRWFAVPQGVSYGVKCLERVCWTIADPQIRWRKGMASGLSLLIGRVWARQSGSF